MDFGTEVMRHDVDPLTEHNAKSVPVLIGHEFLFHLSAPLTIIPGMAEFHNMSKTGKLILLALFFVVCVVTAGRWVDYFWPR